MLSSNPNCLGSILSPRMFAMSDSPSGIELARCLVMGMTLLDGEITVGL